MVDRAVRNSTVTLPLSGRGWQPRRLSALSGRVCQATDLIVLGAAFFGIVILPFFEHHNQSFAGFLELRVSLRNVLVAVLCICTWRTILWSIGVYSPERTRSLADYLFRCIVALNSCTGVVGLIALILHTPISVWRAVEIFWVSCLVVLTAVRGVLLFFDRFLRPRMRRQRSIIIVGSGPRARQVYDEFIVNPDWDYRLQGFVDSEPQGGHVPPELILGGLDQLEGILMHSIVDEVIIALPMKSQYESVGHAIEVCQMLGIQSQYFTDYFGTNVTKRRSSAGPSSGRVVLEVGP